MTPTEAEGKGSEGPGAAGLVPFAETCRRCAAGRLTLYSCPLCLMDARLDGRPGPDRLWTAFELTRRRPGPRATRSQALPPPEDRVDRWPVCGHAFYPVAPVFTATATCGHCGGTGSVLRSLPPAEAAKRAARQAERERLTFKWARSQHALIVLRHEGPRAAREYRPPCEARCRDGHACRRGCIPGLLRCRRHKGRARIPWEVKGGHRDTREHGSWGKEGENAEALKEAS